MLATATTGLPAPAEGWTFEMKWDGIRALAYCEGGVVRVETRNLRDVTVSWPELRPLGAAVPAPTLLDGEIVAFGADGSPSFQRLQERMHVANPAVAARKAAEVPVHYLVFDVLHHDGRDLMPLPLVERRAVLDGLPLRPGPWAVTPTFPGEGEATLDAARASGLEGVVAKRLDAPYLPGARSRSWRKIKLVSSDEFVVGGWSPGEGRRAERIGSLLLGVPHPDGGLAYVGSVGTGFTDAELRRLQDRLAPIERAVSPFTSGPAPKRGARFVAPELVVEVVYTERTDEGILRHPSYKGVRIDKGVGDVDTGGGG